MSRPPQKTRKSRSFMGFLSSFTIASCVVSAGSVAGYYTAQYLDHSESLIAKFAHLQLQSKLNMTSNERVKPKQNVSALTKTNQVFLVKTDVMHASDRLLVSAQKRQKNNIQTTVAASKESYIKPAPSIMTAARDITHSIKPYPLPALTGQDHDPQTIIVQPASLNLGGLSSTGSATIHLRSSLSDHAPEKKIAALPPVKITPLPLNSHEKFRASTQARRMAAEKHCLAQAIYFEARSEPSLGQMAVANVVMNRVRSRHYPNTICGVVFQGEERRHKCQFSFACDGKTDRPRKDKHWRRAERIALQVMEGKKRIRALDDTLHYHADYVRPRWSRKMNRVKKIGRHIFFFDKTLKEEG